MVIKKHWECNDVDVVVELQLSSVEMQIRLISVSSEYNQQGAGGMLDYMRILKQASSMEVTISL